jgi:uncharacterized protein (DUF1330 family)
MAIGTGAGYYQVPGPGAIGLTFPEVRCLFQRTPAKLAIGEKRVPEDPAASRRYAEGAPKSLVPFNGQYLARAGGSKIQTLEGEAPKGYIVVIGFESVEKARGWYDSPAYEAIKPIRQNSTKSRILIVEGDTPP